MAASSRGSEDETESTGSFEMILDFGFAIFD